LLKTAAPLRPSRAGRGGDNIKYKPSGNPNVNTFFAKKFLFFCVARNALTARLLAFSQKREAACRGGKLRQKLSGRVKV
jgi:hypothetical protein